MDALLASLAAAGISGVVAFAIYTFHTLRADISELRSEVRAEIGGLRSQVRAEIGGLRSEVGADITSLREEMRQGFAEIRTDLARIDRARS